MSTGDIVYDTFVDNISRNELETRITQLGPTEILISSNMTDHTKKILRVLMETSADQHSTRMEKLKPEFFKENFAVETIKNLFLSNDMDVDDTGWLIKFS